MNFAQAFANLATMPGGPFVDAVAQWPGAPNYDAGGSIVTPGTPATYACKAQFDAPTQQMREAEGFQQTDVRILVLAASLHASLAPALDTAARINVASGPNAGTWALLSCQRDPVGIGYECRGRKA
jgi:hypothetical protein